VLFSLFSLVYVYFSLFKVRSLPLTLAVINNILRDVFLGLIPFYVGDAIDFFNKSNVRNMHLVDGFVDGDPVIMQEVNRKAVITVVAIVALIVGIVLMFMFISWIVKTIGSYLFV